MTYKIILFIGIAFNIIAQLLLKMGSKQLAVATTITTLQQKIQFFLFNPYFLASIVSYGLGFILYAIVLSKLELSRAYPVASVAAIICIYTLSVLFFNETNSPSKFIGVLCCITGIALILK